MADIMSFLDRKFLYAQDLKGDTVVEFERVTPGAVDSAGGTKRMPMAYFKGFSKPLGLNATNCRTIGQLFGDREAEKMPGRRITLYVTTTKTKEGMQECIRIRPQLPPDEKPAKQTKPADERKLTPPPETKPSPGGTTPLSPDEAALRRSYGAEFKALAATLKLTPASIKERFGDLTLLSTEDLGKVCAVLNQEVMAGQ